MPSPTGTRKNSVVGTFKVASFSRIFWLSASTRTVLWSGREMSSVLGGTVNDDTVWKAHRPSGEATYLWVPGALVGVRRSRLCPRKDVRYKYRWVGLSGEAVK